MKISKSKHELLYEMMTDERTDCRIAELRNTIIRPFTDVNNPDQFTRDETPI